MNTLSDLFHDQLKDIYNAENQLVKALPKMARGANTPQLREAIEAHLAETETQVERLEQIGEQLGLSLKGKKCKAMEGLLEEGKEALEEEGAEAVLDAGIIAAAQKVEHYEISAYGSARALAEQLGHADVAALLQTTLDEESAADEKLSGLSVGVILPAALEGANEEEGEDEPDRKGGSKTASSGARGGQRAGANRTAGVAMSRGAARRP